MRRLEAELEQLARDYGGSSACLACESSFERYRVRRRARTRARRGAGAEGTMTRQGRGRGEEESADEHGWAEEVARLGARVEELERSCGGEAARRVAGW